jgi:hypothetical protein
MLSRQQRVLQALRRVQAWCAANPALVPPAEGPPAAWVPLTRQFDALNTIVAQLTFAAADQGVQTKRTTLAATDEPSLRRHVREELHAVTQVAQALRTTVPGIGVLRMPSTKLQSEALLKAADALTRQATTFQTVLVEHGLAPDFPAQLNSATSALRASIDGRGAARASLTSATKQLKVGSGLGLQYVNIMDAALTKALKHDPARLAEWKSAKRVTVKGTPTAGSTTPPAVTATGTSITGTVAPVQPAQVAVSTTIAPSTAPTVAGAGTPSAQAA